MFFEYLITWLDIIITNLSISDEDNVLIVMLDDFLGNKGRGCSFMSNLFFNKFVKTFPVKLDDISVPFIECVDFIGIKFENLLDCIIVVSIVSYWASCVQEELIFMWLGLWLHRLVGNIFVLFLDIGISMVRILLYIFSSFIIFFISVFLFQEFLYICNLFVNTIWYESIDQLINKNMFNPLIKSNKKSSHRWAPGVSRYFTVPTSSSMILGAVKPLPSLAYALWVAILTIVDARAGPYSKFQYAQVATAPDKMSPIPPHLLNPPSIPTAIFLGPKRISFSPLTNKVKFLKSS